EASAVAREGGVLALHVRCQRRERAGVVEEAGVPEVVREGEKRELVAREVPGGAALEAACRHNERQEHEPERDAPTRQSRSPPPTAPKTMKPPEATPRGLRGLAHDSRRRRDRAQRPNTPLTEELPAVTGRRTLNRLACTFFIWPSVNWTQ